MLRWGILKKFLIPSKWPVLPSQPGSRGYWFCHICVCFILCCIIIYLLITVDLRQLVSCAMLASWGISTKKGIWPRWGNFIFTTMEHLLCVWQCKGMHTLLLKIVTKVYVMQEQHEICGSWLKIKLLWSFLFNLFMWILNSMICACFNILTLFSIFKEVHYFDSPYSSILE